MFIYLQECETDDFTFKDEPMNIRVGDVATVEFFFLFSSKPQLIFLFELQYSTKGRLPGTIKICAI